MSGKESSMAEKEASWRAERRERRGGGLDGGPREQVA